MRLLPVFEPGERVVVGLSGGADSVALLLALLDVPGLHITAAHLNHLIRGAAADRDQRFARTLCEALGVDLVESRIDVPAHAAVTHTGLETAARDIRRQFLADVLRSTGSTAIATAHHAADQAETVLMHLCRGGGVHGASAMRARDGVWIKPLLATTKREILAFLASRGQPYCEDETNRACDTPRNAIRGRVLPLLDDIYPGATRALARYAAIASDEDDYLAAAARTFLDEHAERLPFGSRLRADAAHPAVLRRALKSMTHSGFEAVERMRALLHASRGACDIAGYRAERAGAYLYLIDRAARPPADEIPLADGAALDGIGHMRVAACACEPVKDDRFTQVLDAAALAGAVLRTRRAGDRMRPLHAPGSRLLSDVMTDAKVDRPLRDYMPVVARGTRVLWLPGVCVAQEAAITEHTTHAHRLTWTREDYQWKSAD